jgi:SAM-dependent methyltransferase
MAELDDYAWLTSDAAAPWLQCAAEDARSALQLVEALRRDLPSERARLVVEQVDLRRRGVEKFGERAAAMFFTRVQLEQATDIWTARYKASRLFDDKYVADYCCGIGGDLIAFAERGPAAGWDISPVVCLLAKANLDGRAAITCANVASVTPERRGAWHLDPDRRATGRRATDLSAYGPAPELAMEWLHANSDGCVKLAPATCVPDGWSADAELEWITFDRECRQQVAWLAPEAGFAGRSRATLVSRRGGPLSFAGDAKMPCEATEEPGRFVFDPDPSLLAANLLGAFAAEFELASLGAGSAYLTGDSPLDHGLASRFAVVDCLPLRAADIASYLAARNVGTLEIKKRGVETDPEAFRKKLKLRGNNPATLILTRIGRREVAIVAERESH